MGRPAVYYTLLRRPCSPDGPYATQDSEFGTESD